MSNVMECPRCGEITLAEIGCEPIENEQFLTEFECDECGHYETHIGRS